MQSTPPLDILIRAMPYSALAIYLWLGAALTWKAYRGSVKGWWAHGLSFSSPAIIMVPALRFLGDAEPDPFGGWLFGVSYLVLLALPFAALIAGRYAALPDQFTLADLAFPPREPQSVTAAGHSATTSGGRRGRWATLLGLGLCAAISIFGVLLQPCAAGDRLLGWSGCLRTISLGDVAARLTLSPDGAIVVTQSYTDRSLTLWDRGSGAPRLQLAAGEIADRLAFSQEGGALAAALRSGDVLVWDTATGARQAQLSVSEEVTALALAPRGELLAVGTERGLRLWRRDGQAFAALPPLGEPTQNIHALAFSPDGALLAVAAIPEGDGIATAIWELRSGRRISVIGEGPGQGLQFSGDGRLLVAGGNSFSERPLVLVWDVASGRRLHELLLDESLFGDVALSPDGALVAASDLDERLYLWSLDGRPERRVVAIGASARSLAFVDHTTVALGLYEDAIRLWRVR